jgi:hypothetical protein
MRHTPTPWMVGPEYYDNPKGDMKAGYIGSFADEATSVFRCAKPEDAAFIVKAVNCHDELLKALKMFHNTEDKLHGPRAHCYGCIAIAKAESR